MVAEIAEGRGRTFASFRSPHNTPLRKKLNGRGPTPGNPMRWKRSCQDNAPGEAPDVIAGRGPGPPPPELRRRLRPHAKVSLVKSPFRLLEVPIAPGCLLKAGFSLAKPTARARRRSGPAPVPACMQTWGRDSQRRLDGCCWAWTEEGASLGASHVDPNTGTPRAPRFAHWHFLPHQL